MYDALTASNVLSARVERPIVAPSPSCGRADMDTRHQIIMQRGLDAGARQRGTIARPHNAHSALLMSQTRPMPTRFWSQKRGTMARHRTVRTSGIASMESRVCTTYVPRFASIRRRFAHLWLVVSSLVSCSPPQEAELILARWCHRRQRGTVAG